MPRVKTPALDKAKTAIRDLTDDDQDALAEWLELFVEVRDQNRERDLAKAQKLLADAKVGAE